MSKAKGLIVPAMSNLPVVEATFKSLDDYQTAVGGWIEAIELPQRGITLFVNEEGHPQHLEFNSRATFFWWWHGGHTAHPLVGNIVIVGSPDEHGDPTDVPPELVELLSTQIPFVVLMKLDGVWYRNRSENRDYLEAVQWALIKEQRWKAIQAVQVCEVSKASSYPLRPIPTMDEMLDGA